MLLTYANVAKRDPFVTIAEGLKAERVQSFARYLDRHHKATSDPRAELARELLCAAFGIHPDELTMTQTDTTPALLDLRKELSGLASAITSIIYDLPHTLWDALIIELGNGRHTRALLILQCHANAVRNIIHRTEQADEFAWSAAD